MPTDTLRSERTRPYFRVHRCLATVRRENPSGYHVGLCDVPLDEHGRCPEAHLHKP